jgi:hypothetical protein
MAARNAEAAAVPYVHPPVLLALPGPEFPQVNFDPPLPHGAGAPKERATQRGEPFVIGGRSLYLQREREVDSEDHAERTAGSIWDCSLVLAKYLARHGELLVRGKRVLELGAGQVSNPQTLKPKSCRS